MMMVIDFKSNVLICDEADQKIVLSLLSSSKLYKQTGYRAEDSTFTLAEEMPEVHFIRNNQVLGLEAALKEAKEQISKDNSRYYSLYTEKNTVEKELKALQEKFDSLSAVVISANATLEE